MVTAGGAGSMVEVKKVRKAKEEGMVGVAVVVVVGKVAVVLLPKGPCRGTTMVGLKFRRVCTEERRWLDVI